METIARHLGISRSSVSRLLSYACEIGLVRISASVAPGNKGTLSGQISETFGVQTSVAPVHDVHTEVNRPHNVSPVAAKCLIDMLKPGVTLGIAWGNTTLGIIRCMPRVNFPGSTVVQLNRVAIATESGMSYTDVIISRVARAIGGRMAHLPAPTLFNYTETKGALWRERSVQAALKTIEDRDIALFGIGPLSARLPSHVYSGGSPDIEEPAAAQRDRIVDDVCTVLLREDDSTDMASNLRASGPAPETSRRIPRRLCVVVGASKALPLLGVLRAKAITDPVLDDGAARGFLELVCPCVA